MWQLDEPHSISRQPARVMVCTNIVMPDEMARRIDEMARNIVYVEVRLDGLKWDLSCVCGSLRWGAGSTRGAAIPICAKNENREKREKRSQGICGFWESQAKGYSGFGNPKPRDMRGLGIPSQGICGVWGSQAKGYTAL